MFLFAFVCCFSKKEDVVAVTDSPPEASPDLEYWITGSTQDTLVSTQQGLLLIGGGTEPDSGFLWWNAKVNGGDVVVLRVSGEDGYNDYLYSDIGAIDSVETLKVTSQELASDPYVLFQVRHAEGLFFAGGDQWDYISLWSDTPLQEAIQDHISQGKPIGGTSAGLAILGEWVFSAQEGTVYSEEVLENPYNQYVQLVSNFVSIPQLSGFLLDSHFSDRDRLGRLIGFVARLTGEGEVLQGWGIDENTALLIDEQGAQVVGSGSVFRVYFDRAPERCLPEEPLEWSSVFVEKQNAEESIVQEWEVVAGELIRKE